MHSLIETADKSKKGSGPPNRMNDLAYKDWMKFQKSFFRYRSSQALVEECIYFFTKAVWPQTDQPSRSLIVGFTDFNAAAVPSPRIVEAFNDLDTIEKLFALLTSAAQQDHQYDFALIDLRRLVFNEETLDHFLTHAANKITQLLRKLLVPQHYCGLVVGMPGKGGSGFPLPWSVALACRNELRLRDEKIGLVEEKNTTVYCLFMQADDDSQQGDSLVSQALRLAKDTTSVPAWIIPKPPPRKKHEILHPAKYPETLVEEFIELFSAPGDNVLDPMVGTGSTVVAALRKDRNGYGIDLMPDFVEIAQRRVEAEKVPTLFDQFNVTAKGVVIQGDALKLREIDNIRDITFNYCITSPPYWSMLQNPGSENQKKRRDMNLRLVYSEHERDLGNVNDYEEFMSLLVDVYNQVADKLVDGGYLTIVVKNVKRDHTLYTLAWDLVARLCGPDGKYEYVGTTLWCQDDVGLKPFAVGIYWVSNILHHYCLHFRKCSNPLDH